MMYWDFFKMSLRSLQQRKKRSWLTMIGIFIGVATIVSLMSVGQGMQDAINDQFASMGSDKIMVMAGSGVPLESASPLTLTELEVVRGVRGVEYATASIAKMSPIKFQDETIYQFVAGLPVDEESLRVITGMEAFHVMDGRMLKQGDRFKAVVGYLYNVNAFDKKVEMGHKLTINGYDFDVIGRMARIGTRQKDLQIIIPQDIFRDIYDEPEEIMAVIAQVKPTADMSKVAEDIKRQIRRTRDEREGEETFQVQTFEELMKTAGSVIAIVQAFLLGIAFISLLVGGVGIMNTMYTSVLERTREIGVMKAIGARNSHIMSLFLIEAGILGMVGGSIGIVIGLGLGKAVEYLADTQLSTGLIKANTSPELILTALAFSFLVGCLSGVLPARAAAKQNPVEALHYE